GRGGCLALCALVLPGEAGYTQPKRHNTRLDHAAPCDLQNSICHCVIDPFPARRLNLPRAPLIRLSAARARVSAVMAGMRQSRDEALGLMRKCLSEAMFT